MPTGSHIRIDYEAEGGPRLEVRVQELYGVTIHPTVGGNRTPLTLSLTSPAHRPIQITKDLPAFWDGSWAEVRSDMKGRYPRHVWPENPRDATATTPGQAQRYVKLAAHKELIQDCRLCLT